MRTTKESFEQMQTALMNFVDMVNASHVGGQYFGTKYLLHPAEIHTIAAIGKNETIGVTQLAQQLNVSKPTVSECIQKLVKKGLIWKEKSPVDTKAVILWLTADGNTACVHHERHHKRMYEIFCDHFGDKSHQKIEVFTKTFTQISQIIEKINEYEK